MASFKVIASLTIVMLSGFSGLAVLAEWTESERGEALRLVDSELERVNGQWFEVNGDDMFERVLKEFGPDLDVNLWLEGTVLKRRYLTQTLWLVKAMVQSDKLCTSPVKVYARIMALAYQNQLDEYIKYLKAVMASGLKGFAMKDGEFHRDAKRAFDLERRLLKYEDANCIGQIDEFFKQENPISRV